MDVPCGHCGYCLRRRINDWVLRCKNEMKRSPYSYFLTLTFTKVPDLSDKFIGKRQTRVNGFKYPLQLFFKRCRKFKLKFRYLAIGDYGDTFGRPHYHVLYFSDIPVDTDLVHSLWSSSTHQENGFVTVDRISVHRVRYVVEYGLLAKLDWDKSDVRQAPFFLMSKRPAIGNNYITSAMVRYHRHADPMYRDGSFQYALPRFYRKKIFNYNSKTGLGFRYQGSDDIVVRTQQQVKALAKFHPDSATYLAQRRMLSADRYLNKLRERKRQKNKML